MLVKLNPERRGKKSNIIWLNEKTGQNFHFGTICVNAELECRRRRHIHLMLLQSNKDNCYFIKALVRRAIFASNIAIKRYCDKATLR